MVFGRDDKTIERSFASVACIEEFPKAYTIFVTTGQFNCVQQWKIQLGFELEWQLVEDAAWSVGSGEGVNVCKTSSVLSCTL